MPEFVHLHNHSHYSLLDGACRPSDLVQAAVENKMSAVALTDHGVMFGALEFYKVAKAAGVKPIVGSEMYVVTTGSRFDHSSAVDRRGPSTMPGAYQHLVLLVKDERGYRNLIKLTSLAHTEGFYYKPRIDMELLHRYHDGLVALSACMGGIVSAHLVNGNYDHARKVAIMFRELFSDDFYLEIQNHGMERERAVLEGMPRLARELGIKLVATNDVHYIKPEHAIPHNILLLIPEASSTNAPNVAELRYGTDQIYFKTAEEMALLFREFPESIESTLEIAEKCNLELSLKQNHMPEFPIPPESGVSTLDEYLEKLVYEGAERRYGSLSPEVRDRLSHELQVIKEMGYSGYFLIVQDFINAARKMGAAVGPGRGSAAGSIVAYALGITSIDPLKYDLLFERFLNPERVTMPDIDVDFADDKRELIIQYVRDKYGANSVAQIITFGTLSARAVIKDVGRVLGIPLSVVDSITKCIPSIQGRVMPLSEALRKVPELHWLNETKDVKLRNLIDYSLVLEGLHRNSSTHAAGVVIAPGDLTDYVPIYKTPQTDVMTQYNMKDLEDAGLLKIDLLGITTLRAIERALELIRVRHNVTIDLDQIPLDDAATLNLFAAGATVGIFQFESSGMREYLRKLKPTSISDLVAMNALYRPGPMEMIDDFIARKHGQQKIEYLHPKLEPILRETYGVVVYQEQVIRIASEIAGFSLSKADLMRRAMGKKDKKLMAALKKEFVEGAVQRGVPRKTAGEIFDLIEKFASYGFNKSHSVAYALVAYQTAYLKANYPVEYMAAILSAEIGNAGKIVLFIDECRTMGINVLPPDVNESDASFTVTERGIRFGLSAIRNVGVSAVEAIVKARESGGPFKNLYDFCRRVDLRVVNRKAIESLIQAGAFDSLGGHRAQLFEAVPKAILFGQGEKDDQGQPGLFDISVSNATVRYPPLPDVAPWSQSEQLSREKGVLGFYVSGHLLDRYEDEVNAFATVQLGKGEAIKDGSTVHACGIVADVRVKPDRKGQKMAFFTLEDFTGKADCTIFSSSYTEYAHILTPEAMVMVIGKAEMVGDRLRILVSEVYPLEKVAEKFTRSIIVSLNVDEVKENTILALRQLAEQHKGNCSMYFSVEKGKGQILRRYRATKYDVQVSHEFLTALKKLVGKHHVKINS